MLAYAQNQIYGFSVSLIGFQDDQEGAGMPKSLGSFCVFSPLSGLFLDLVLWLTKKGRRGATPMPLLAGWLSGQVVRNRCYGMHRHPQSRVFRSCEQLQLRHI